MIAVVTGSSGFIGSHLVDSLLERGAEVRALYRPESKVRDSRVKRFDADLLDDRALRASGVWRGATHVFHLAGITHGSNRAQFHAGNVLPTANVLAAIASRTPSVPRVVLVSSQAAAGPASSSDRPVRESDQPNPVEDYGASKLQGERASIRYEPVLPMTIVRPGAVYGPRDKDFLALFRAATSTTTVSAVPVDNRLSIVHVADVVRALLVCATVPAAIGQTYFVANDEPTTWRELYHTIGEFLPARRGHIALPTGIMRTLAPIADAIGALTGRVGLLTRQKVTMARQPFWLCSSQRIRDELDWSPVVPLREGLHSTYLWYVAQGLLREPRIPGVVARSNSTGET